MVDRRDPRFAAAELGDLDPDGLGTDLRDVGADRLHDLLRVLIGHQPAADFGGSPGGDDRLRAWALVSTPDAVDVQRGARPLTLRGREARLAMQRLQPVRLL